MRIRILALLAVALAAGCTTYVVQPNAAAAVAPQLAVESFLKASNARDLHGMGRLFGTADGALLDTGSTFGCAFKKIGSWFGGQPCRTRQDVEIRMEAIASVLHHDDYRIVREEMVAGRDSPATRVLVDLTIDGELVSGVPFVVVQTSEGRWLVEQVDLQRVMRR